MCANMNLALSKWDLVSIQDFNPEVVIVQGFIAAIRKTWEWRWEYLQPKFEVPFSKGAPKALPAEVLDSTFDVVHIEVLQLGVRGKSKNVEIVQIVHQLARVVVIGSIRK